MTTVEVLAYFVSPLMVIGVGVFGWWLNSR
jgi:hypothetical protein